MCSSMEPAKQRVRHLLLLKAKAKGYTARLCYHVELFYSQHCAFFFFFLPAVLNYEEDIAKYTVRVSCDPRACNHIVIYRLPKNIFTQNELISLWEKKTGRVLERVHVPLKELVELSQSKRNLSWFSSALLGCLFYVFYTEFSLIRLD